MNYNEQTDLNMNDTTKHVSGFNGQDKSLSASKDFDRMGPSPKKDRANM